MEMFSDAAALYNWSKTLKAYMLLVPENKEIERKLLGFIGSHIKQGLVKMGYSKVIAAILIMNLTDDEREIIRRTRALGPHNMTEVTQKLNFLAGSGTNN